MNEHIEMMRTPLSDATAAIAAAYFFWLSLMPKGASPD